MRPNSSAAAAKIEVGMGVGQLALVTALAGPAAEEAAIAKALSAVSIW